MYARPAALLAFLGATVGPLLDGLHTYSGVTWYPDAQFLKSVWWCPPLFCAAGVAIGIGRLLTEKVLKHETVAPGGKVVAITMATFIVGYAASGFLPVSEVARAVLLLITAVILWATVDRTFIAALCMLTAGAGGWLVEHTLVGRGLFFHRGVMLDGVALWIPPLYFIAALAIGAVARQTLPLAAPAGRGANPSTATD